MLTDNTLNHVNADDTLRKVNILFLGGAKRVSMGRKFIEAGRRMGLDVRLYSYELSPYVPIACIAEVIIGLKWADPEVTAHIHGIIEQKGIDILVPFVDGAVEVAARCRDEYGDVWVPVGDAALSARMFDKVEADSLFRSLDLPVPGLEKFPLIAKPRFGSASKGLIIIHDAAELDALGERARDYLIQECITRRKEITVDCYVTLEGEIITAVSRYRIDVQGGEVVTTATFRNPQVYALIFNILNRTGLRGAVTIQLIEQPDGNLLLMEINPRLGGGAVTAVAAGADIPGYILGDWAGMPLTPCHDWNDHILLTRYLSDFVFDLSEKQS